MLSGIAVKWRTITRKLRLQNDNMDIIEDKCRGNVRKCLELAITEWLNLDYNWKKNGMPSWKKLAEVVRGVNGALYLKIVKEHPKEKKTEI